MDPLHIEGLIDYFGSVKEAIVTLLQSTTSGLDWREVYWLLDHNMSMLPWLFLFYILFFAIAAWNIVTSTFVEKALKLAQPDIETLMMEQNMKDIADSDELMSLFKEADADNSQGINFSEFQSLAEHPKFRAFLHVRGIAINN